MVHVYGSSRVYRNTSMKQPYFLLKAYAKGLFSVHRSSTE